MLNYINQEKQAGREVNRADVAASFQQAVMEVVVTKTVAAAKERNEKRIVLAGGVAANSCLREMMQQACDKEGIELMRPKPLLCTDNGAMIAAQGYYKYRELGADGLDMDAYPSLEL